MSAFWAQENWKYNTWTHHKVLETSPVKLVETHLNIIYIIYWICVFSEIKSLCFQSSSAMLVVFWRLKTTILVWVSLSRVCVCFIFKPYSFLFLITHLFRSMCSLNTHSCPHDGADKGWYSSELQSMILNCPFHWFAFFIFCCASVCLRLCGKSIS